MRDRRLLGRDLPGTQPDATYAYDLSGRMVSAVQDGRTVSFAYDALGRRSSVTFGNGTVQTLTFDAASRLTGLANNLTRVTTDPIATPTAPLPIGDKARTMRASVETGRGGRWALH